MGQRVGGGGRAGWRGGDVLLANNNHPAEFIQSNLAVQTNVMHEAWRTASSAFFSWLVVHISPGLSPADQGGNL